MKTGVRLAGAGGHGLITASIILADAAMRAGRNVCQTQSYGPEARGGAAHADVIISDGAILHPKIVKPDLLVALTQEGCNAFARNLAEKGTLLIDAEVAGPTGIRALSAPIITSARTKFPGEAYSGIISAGAVSAIVEGVGIELYEAAIKERLPKNSWETNMKAFMLGRQLGFEALSAPPPFGYEADF